MANFPTSVSTDANLYIAVNGLQTTLASPATDTDTTLTLASTSSFPTTGMVTIDNNEVVAYTGISGAQLTGCTRGADGTTALPHNTGVTVGLTVVAAHHNRLKDEIIAVEGALGAGFAKGNLSEATSAVLLVSGGTSAVIGSGTTIEVKQSSGSQSGYLSSTDWTTFNNKQNTITTGNLTAGSSKIAVSGGTGAVIGSGTSVDLGSVTLDDLSNVVVPSPATNDILTYNGTNWVNAGAPAASLPLAGGTMTGDITMSNQTGIVLKELTTNGTLSTTLKAADDVTASYTLKLPPAVGTGNQTLVDVAGDGVLSWGTAAGAVSQYVSYVVGTPSGSYSGSLTQFDLPFSYVQDGKTIQVMYNGQVLVPTDDYTETLSTRVTTSTSLVSGAKIAFKAISSAGVAGAVTHLRENYVVGTASGSYTGSTTVFNLTNSYTPGGVNLQVYLDGDLQTVGASVDYVETNTTTVTFNNALVSGQKVTFLFSQTVATAGTVSSGTASQIAYFPSSGSTVASSAAAMVAAGGNLVVTGTATNDSAAAGKVGEYVESYVTSVSIPGSSSTYGDITSISLSAGDWDVTLFAVMNNGTNVTEADFGISTTSGNNFPDLATGKNATVKKDASNINSFSAYIPNYRMAVATTTTVYAKMVFIYTLGTAPVMYARLSARRVR
jgi:hypothetical protein